jgi:hypothetical protein
MFTVLVCLWLCALIVSAEVSETACAVAVVYEKDWIDRYGRIINITCKSSAIVFYGCSRSKYEPLYIYKGPGSSDFEVT